MSPGARPAGTESEAAAAQAVQQMFDSIAPRYDLLNHLLSANLDRLWWWRAARSFRPILARADAAVLDLCCGTGDMTMALLKRRPAQARPVLAVDFSPAMLQLAARKFAAHTFAAKHVTVIETDALHLPLTDGSLDLVTSAFGFRNLVDYEAGLAEIFRVLQPGGELGILEFNQPQGLLGKAYLFYFQHVLPKIGRLISRNSSAYTYLPASVERFPQPPRMLQMLQAAGFQDALWTSYSFGVAGLYRARKPH